MSDITAFDGSIPLGARLRAYDYNPALINGQHVFMEGVVLRHLELPFMAYEILCDKCTGVGREGHRILVPVHIAANEFEGRVVRIP